MATFSRTSLFLNLFLYFVFFCESFSFCFFFSFFFYLKTNLFKNKGKRRGGEGKKRENLGKQPLMTDHNVGKVMISYGTKLMITFHRSSSVMMPNLR